MPRTTIGADPRTRRTTMARDIAPKVDASFASVYEYLRSDG
ncbi:MAG: hypothetical protein ACLP62_02885 [Acidimicrobiales bacterium]